MSATEVPAYCEQLSKNVYVIYLKDNVSTDSVRNILRRVCVDHGMDVTPIDDNTFSAKAREACKDMSVVFRTGRHAVKGNLIAMEYDNHTAEKVATVVAAIAVVVVVAAVVILLASNSNGGGGGGGCSGGGGGGSSSNFHCHHHSGPTFVYMPDFHYAPRIVNETVASNFSNVPRQPAEFKTRKTFFTYFFRTVANVFANYGFVRVPDAVAKRHHNKAIPLDGFAPHQAKLSLLGSKTYCVNVAPFPDDMPAPTLRIDVIGNGNLNIIAKHGSVPQVWSTRTIKGRAIGNYSYALVINNTTSPPIQPGLWYFTVSNANTIVDVEFTVGAAVFDDVDKDKLCHSVYGEVHAQSVSLEAGEAPPPSYAPYGYNELEQRAKRVDDGDEEDEDEEDDDEDWQLVTMTPARTAVRASQAGPAHLRGVPLTNVSESEALASGVAGMSVTTQPFGMLPVPDSVPEPSAPELPTPEGFEAEMNFDEPVPPSLCCPITQDIMRDPVIAPDGFTYEESAIRMWFAVHPRSPLTGLETATTPLQPNLTIRSMIAEWITQHRVAASAPSAPAAPN